VYIGPSDEQFGNRNVFFRETASGRYAPRAVAADLAPSDSCLGGVFRLEHHIHGEFGANKNWSKAYYVEGWECIDPVLENIRREAEQSDCLQGFQFVHSLGGGSGGGFGSLVLSNLRDEYPDSSVSAFSVLPSTKVSDVVVEPYTIGFTLRKLVEFADICHVLDNGAYFDLCTASLGIGNPTLGDLNELIAQDLRGATSSVRFPHQLSGDLRKLAANLVVAPQLKFVSVSSCPIVAGQATEGAHQATGLSVADLIRKQLQWPGRTAAATRGHRDLASCWSFQGSSVTAKELYESDPALFEMNAVRSGDGACGSPAPSGKVTANVCPGSTVSQPTACTVVRNSTHLVEPLSSVAERYERMWRTKAFTMWYTGEGMDESEFQEGLDALKTLIGAYRDQMAVSS
jgi:tubulin beta